MPKISRMLGKRPREGRYNYGDDTTVPLYSFGIRIHLVGVKDDRQIGTVFRKRDL